MSRSKDCAQWQSTFWTLWWPWSTPFWSPFSSRRAEKSIVGWQPLTATPSDLSWHPCIRPVFPELYTVSTTGGVQDLGHFCLMWNSLMDELCMWTHQQSEQPSQISAASEDPSSSTPSLPLAFHGGRCAVHCSPRAPSWPPAHFLLHPSWAFPHKSLVCLNCILTSISQRTWTEINPNSSYLHI